MIRGKGKNKKPEINDGIVRWYYEDGKLKAESTYKEGYLDGISTFYFENGNKRAREFYADGRLHGLCIYYFETGEVKAEEYYKSGVLKKQIKYSKEGKVISSNTK